WPVQPSGQRTWASFPELEDLQRESKASGSTPLSAVAGVTDLRPILMADDGARELQALAVSHELFGMLGVRPALGRDFTTDDDPVGAAPVVILSDTFWRTQFGGDPAVVDRSIQLNDGTFKVVGVLPPRFSILPATSVLPHRVDVWLPLQRHLASRDR